MTARCRSLGFAERAPTARATASHRAAQRDPNMHFAISSTWGPTDPTRAMLPFIFAASALQAGDRVTLMLFHDAVLLAVEGAGARLVPVGPPNRYEEVASQSAVKLWACKPCVDARGLAGTSL